MSNSAAAGEFFLGDSWGAIAVELRTTVIAKLCRPENKIKSELDLVANHPYTYL